MLIENLDLVYGIRALQKKDKGLDIPLWTKSRPTAYTQPGTNTNRSAVKPEKSAELGSHQKKSRQPLQGSTA
jgi:hypothetical protein